MTKQLDYMARKITAKLKLNLKKRAKNAAFAEKLSPDRNGAERSKGGKVFRPLNGAQAEPCRAGLWLWCAPLK